MYIIFILTLVIDQIVKYLISTKLSYGEGFVLIPNLIEISHEHNTGMAFSFFAQQPEMMKILVTILVVVLTFVALRLPEQDYKQASMPFAHTGILSRIISKPTRTQLAFGFILGGAYSNLIDRYAYGFVIDYINFLFVDFAVFNIADIALNIGAVILLFDMLQMKGESPVN